jgi:ribosomal protein L16 Arg81 hydroxylase
MLECKYPRAADVKWMEFTLKAGDFLFIPQGWWHCVEGLEENVSVSFTC